MRGKLSLGVAFALCAGCSGGASQAHSDGPESADLAAGVDLATGNPDLSSANGDAGSFANAGRGIAVGSGGTILRTTTGGATWVSVATGSAADFYRLAFVGTAVGRACGTGFVYKTTDLGATWSVEKADATMIFMGMSFPDASHGWLVGAANVPAGGSPYLDGVGFILRTSDGGASYTALTTPMPLASFFGNASFVDNMNGWIAGQSKADGSALLFHTSNGGASWQAQSLGSTPIDGLNNIRFLDAQYGFAVSGGGGSLQNGTVLRTVNGGVTWLNTQVDPVKGLSGLFAIDHTTVWINGDTPPMKSTDGAVAFTAETAGAGVLSGLSFINASDGFQCGFGGIIDRTLDGGASWTRQTSGTVADLKDIIAFAPQ